MVIKINTNTMAEHSVEHKIDLIYKLKNDKVDGWKFPIESGFIIMELINYFYRVNYLMSELLGLVLDFEDFYQVINYTSCNSDKSISYNMIEYSDSNIIKSKLDSILIGLQKIDLDKTRMQNLFMLAFIMNEGKFRYCINSNLFVNKLLSCLDEIQEKIVNDFSEIMEFNRKQNREIYKVIHNNYDIVLINRIYNNSNIEVSVLQKSLNRISKNGTLDKIIAVSKRLCEIKLQICDL